MQEQNTKSRVMMLLQYNNFERLRQDSHIKNEM